MIKNSFFSTKRNVYDNFLILELASCIRKTLKFSVKTCFREHGKDLAKASITTIIIRFDNIFSRVIGAAYDRARVHRVIHIFAACCLRTEFAIKKTDR